MEENPGMAHKIVLNNRNQGNLTGILDVISFDEKYHRAGHGHGTSDHQGKRPPCKPAESGKR